MHDISGCIHFHSAYSYDCRTPLSAICQSAFKAGLDFAIVTDHFRLDARAAGWEKWHASGDRRLLLLVGEEISPRYNHYIALNIQKPIVVWKTDAQAQHAIDAVNDQGGFGFIAHPDHEGAPLAGARAYPWIDWNVKNFTGLGIWDLMDDWTSSLSSPWAILYACLRPAHVLRGPKAQTLARWDRLCQSLHCVAIGETDNHGHRKRFLGFRKHVFPYDYAFQTIRTHVLLPEPLVYDLAADQKQIFEMLRRGQSYVSFDLWNNATGFTFEIFDATQRATMGGEITHRGPTLLEAKVPGSARARFRIIRNGQTIWEERSRPHLERDVDLPGVYRIEVDQWVSAHWRPWIFSNPIWVR